ncbi:MAG: HEAT repeat domain-containing protein [Salibacteraceae bacterium]|jgi:HEAT repeat protein|nr:HEAT repeat domain-containing protein [Salibacteraceae bacterium]
MERNQGDVWRQTRGLECGKEEITMEELKKKQVLLIQNLTSSNETLIISALEAIPEDGSPEMLPSLIKLWVSNPKQEITNLIEKTLFNLKDPAVIPVLIDLLRSDEYASNRAAVMTVIWQSGLDVSQEVVLLTNIAIAGDYMTAFEAMTILDHMEEFPEEPLQESIRMLEKAVQRKGDTQALLLNLHQLLIDKLLD